MKPVLPLLFVALAMTFSCQQAEPVGPYYEREITEVKTCHLFAEAIVEYREAGHNGSEPFYYLAMLDENGNWKEDVYTDKVQYDKYQVGEKISVTYHYKLSNGFNYVSACGGEGSDPTVEMMTEIVACEVDSNS